MTNWDNNMVFYADFERRYKAGPVLSWFKVSVFSFGLTPLWHTYKRRVPLRTSSVLLWIDLNVKSKPGNERQTP